MNRRQQIVETAFHAIADRGLEGLRVRAVSQQVGINNATLHHYFASKEDLIVAVTDHVIQMLQSTRDANRPEHPKTFTEILQAHLADNLYQLRHTPERFVVLTELLLRSLRSPKIRTRIHEHDERWRQFIRKIIVGGQQQGEFRPDIDADVAAHLFITLLKGVLLHSLAEPHLQQQIVDFITKELMQT